MDTDILTLRAGLGALAHPSPCPRNVPLLLPARSALMHLIPTALRGPLFMVIATGSYVVNDTMMKLATTGLPPYEVLFLRGVAATIWSIPILLLLGFGRQFPLIFEKRVLLRNVIELGA